MSARTSECLELQLLTKQEIDRRIGDVASSVFATTTAHELETETLRPRWISAADLVERMRPFLVYN